LRVDEVMPDDDEEYRRAAQGVQFSDAFLRQAAPFVRPRILPEGEKKVNPPRAKASVAS
jgi:hypothetical protein